MKKKYFRNSLLITLVLFGIVIFSGFYNSNHESDFKPKFFPAFDKKTVDGKTINNDYFKKGNSLVVLAHLGCPPAMILMRDIQKRRDLFDYQFILFLENTPEQVAKFNGDSANIWYETRKQFGLLPITENVVAECTTENVKIVRGKTIVGSQCREMSKKLKSKSSPTIYFVNENGEIERKAEGYPIDNTLEVRVKSLLRN